MYFFFRICKIWLNGSQKASRMVFTQNKSCSVTTIFKVSFFMTFSLWIGFLIRLSSHFSLFQSSKKAKRENKKQVSGCCVGMCKRRLASWIIENPGKTNLMHSQYYTKIYSHSLSFQSSNIQTIEIVNCMKNTKANQSKTKRNVAKIVPLIIIKTSPQSLI